MIFAPRKEKIDYDYIEIYKGRIHRIRHLFSDSISGDKYIKIKSLMYMRKNDFTYQPRLF